MPWLRYDKRGVGESGGMYAGAGTVNHAAMFPLLAGDMAAAPEATFAVIFSGPTVSVGLEIYYSLADLDRSRRRPHRDRPQQPERAAYAPHRVERQRHHLVARGVL